MTRNSSNRFPLAQFIRHSWQILAGVFLGIFGLAYVAWGATYNFNFNNVEQGDNGVATPSVSLSGDGQVVKKQAADAPAQQAAQPVPPPQAVPAPPPAANVEQAPPAPVSTAALSTSDSDELKPTHFRFGLGVAGIHSYGGSNLDFEPSLTLTWFPNRDIGLSLFGSTMQPGGQSLDDHVHFLAGLEVEFVPIHISLGRDGDLFDLGLVGGAEIEFQHNGIVSNETYYDDSGNPQTYASRSDSIVVRPEAGLRASVNLGKAWSIIGDVRFNQDYAATEAALAFRM